MIGVESVLNVVSLKTIIIIKISGMVIIKKNTLTININNSHDSFGDKDTTKIIISYKYINSMPLFYSDSLNTEIAYINYYADIFM